MRKKGVFLSILLSISVFLTGYVVNPYFALALSQEPDNQANPRTILSVSTELSKKATNSMYYRVMVVSASGISDSMTVTIVLQKNESGSWIDKKTVLSKTENKVKLMDVSGTIDTKSYGSGSYRIKVTASDTVNGIIHTVGPCYSITVVM